MLAAVNRGSEQGEGGERAVRQFLGSEEEEEAQRRRLGDGHLDVIYTL